MSGICGASRAAREAGFSGPAIRRHRVSTYVLAYRSTFVAAPYCSQGPQFGDSLQASAREERPEDGQSCIIRSQMLA